jgi:hypothetical protein
MLASKTFHDTTAAVAMAATGNAIGQRAAARQFRHATTPAAIADQCNVALDLEQHLPHRRAAPALRDAVGAGGGLFDAADERTWNSARRCAHLPCKKILFTGAADEKVAVGAFNRGLIDRYIKKSDDHALDILEVEIAALQRAYFDWPSPRRCANWCCCITTTSSAIRRWPSWCAPAQRQQGLRRALHLPGADRHPDPTTSIDGKASLLMFP